MTFGSNPAQGFGPHTYQNNGRATVENQTQQAIGGKSGGFLGNLLGAAGLVTSLIPGAQVAAPFLSAAGALANGDFMGGAKQAAGGVANMQGGGGGELFPEEGGGTTESLTDGAMDMAAYEPIEDEPTVPVDPAFSTPQEYEQYLNEYFMQNPYLLMAMLGGQQQLPGMGFNQFQQQPMQNGFMQNV